MGRSCPVLDAGGRVNSVDPIFCCDDTPGAEPVFFFTTADALAAAIAILSHD